MDEKDWQILKTLYSEGNITKASEVLYVSQPALTKRIKHIENDLNVKIISRSTKGIRFTLEGEYLVNYATEMLNKLQKTRDTLTNMSSNTVEGTLRLGVSINFAYNHLPNLLKKFTELYPKVKTHVYSGFSSEMINKLQSEKVQIAIVRGNFNWTGPKRLIQSENIYLVSKEKIELDQLPESPRIDYKTDHLLKKQLDNWWKENFDIPPVITMEVDNSLTCVGMVSQGLGYAILPGYILNKYKNLNLVKLKNNNGEYLKRDTWIIYHKSDIVLSTVREFISFMEEVLE